MDFKGTYWKLVRENRYWDVILRIWFVSSGSDLFLLTPSVGCKFEFLFAEILEIELNVLHTKSWRVVASGDTSFNSLCFHGSNPNCQSQPGFRKTINKGQQIMPWFRFEFFYLYEIPFLFPSIQSFFFVFVFYAFYSIKYEKAARWIFMLYFCCGAYCL